MNRVRNYIEWQVFGVCTRIGELMGVSTFTIRKYFIYISCLTLGSPIVLYFFATNNLKISRYNHINVANKPTLANHSIYCGAPCSTCCSIKPKSNIKLNAAIPATTADIPIDIKEFPA